MSAKERVRSSAVRKKSSRRATTDTGRSSIESDNDDLKRFPYLLQKYCDSRFYYSLPNIISYLVRNDGIPIQVDHPLNSKKTETIVHAYSTMEMKLKKIICESSSVIDTRLFYALQHTFLHFPTLTLLKLDFCKLNYEHIFILQKNLPLKKTLTELSLTGNPIKEQSFHYLIQCGLKVLVLKFCEINEKGLINMAKAFFNCPLNTSTLVHLDLSSNMVFNEGCEPLANILKCNRSLQSLNLTDCKIKDGGFKVLMSAFLKFPLDEKAIAFRRKARFEYFKLLQKSNLPKGVGYVEQGDGAEMVTDKLLEVEEIIKKHPFLEESLQDNFKIFCKGNQTLESLNLAYNHLTKSSLDLLLKTIMEQNITLGSEKGLQRIILEGNVSNCQEWDNAKITIQDFLASKKFSSKPSSSSIKSRHSLRTKSSRASSASNGQSGNVVT